MRMRRRMGRGRRRRGGGGRRRGGTLVERWEVGYLREF
jgi:hypothetical protein